MNGTLLSIYHHFPPPVRNIAASLRGLYLRSWRYGPETEQLVEEALERDYWSVDQWKAFQENRLGFVLHRAATQVPYYREQWSQRRRKGDQASWESLENWPILEKEPLRQNPKAFVADDCDVRWMYHEHTSGTTGKSLDLWWSRETVRAWYALFEARWRRWYYVSRHDRWAILGGQLVRPVSQQYPPFWVWNSALNQLYMSSYHLAPKLIPFYLEALKRYRITYIWGYTSSIFALAQEVLRQKRCDQEFRVVITNAEPLFDRQREVIEAAFRCPVRETYGMSEIVAAASECEAGNLHLWPEVGVIEILNPDGSPSVRTGELVSTGLINVDMPLVRYRVGDRATLAVNGDPCSCGRKLPQLDSIDGRNDDVLYTRDGRQIGRLDPVFKASLPVREAQIVQETLDRVRIKYIPTPDFTPSDGESMVERLQARMGVVEVILEPVEIIPRTSAGKFRAVICNLSEVERRAIEGLP